MEMQALIEEIAALVQKVKNGTATLGELEAFAAATQQLNERAIILKYKAYEAKIYGDPISVSHEDMADRETHSNPLQDSINETVEETAPETEDLSFDLFSMDDISDSKETEQEIVIEETPEETIEPVMEDPAPSFFQEGNQPETSFEKTAPVIPDPEEEKTEPVAQPASSGMEHPIIKKALINDGTMQSRLLSVRLETLKSAFGLNERMLIVRELFGGSNEAYNNAIETLDNLAEINSARSKVSDYATQYGWREDNDLAIEFVQKVERRYV